MTETKRRGIFTDEPIWGSIQEPKGGYQSISSSTSAPATNLLDMMPVAEERPKRNRQWEKAQMANQVSYRGIPEEVRAAIKTIAEELDVNQEDIARAFLEFGLYCFRNNEIEVQAHIKGRHMTLFPDGWNRQPAWVDCGWGKKPEVSTKERKKREPANWHSVVTYRRIPQEVKKAIQGISALHTVPVGEVATLFFLHALQAYQKGRLVLNPQPKIAASLQPSYQPIAQA
jgi:hypothetical protein